MLSTTSLVGAKRKKSAMSWQSMMTAGFVVTLATVVRSSDIPENLEYARISLYKRHNHNQSEHLEATISGVFALYGPVKSVSGVLAVASPIDGCGPIEAPDIDTTQPLILLTRLSSDSTCTAMEQGIYAAKTGAVAVLNMAPQRTSYIYLLESSEEEQERLQPADISQVAISGSSGYRFLQHVIEHHGHGELFVSIQSSETPDEQSQVLDLVVAIACMVIAILVLLYAYRVGRNLCLPPPPMANEFEDPELAVEIRRAKREKMKILLATHIKIVEYEGGEDVEDTCAICIDQLENGNEIRKLHCNHFFHVECIDPWLINKHTCPLCKDDVLARAEAEIGEIDCSAYAHSEAEEGSLASSRVRPRGATLRSSVPEIALNSSTAQRRPSRQQHTFEGNVYEGDSAQIYLPRMRQLAAPQSEISDSSMAMTEVIEMFRMGGLDSDTTSETPASTIGRDLKVGDGSDQSACSWDSAGEKVYPAPHSASTASIV